MAPRLAALAGIPVVRGAAFERAYYLLDGMITDYRELGFSQGARMVLGGALLELTDEGGQAPRHQVAVDLDDATTCLAELELLLGDLVVGADDPDTAERVRRARDFVRVVSARSTFSVPTQR